MTAAPAVRPGRLPPLDWRRYRSCVCKVAYASLNEAQAKVSKNERIYRCRYAEHWHRATRKK